MHHKPAFHHNVLGNVATSEETTRAPTMKFTLLLAY